MPCLAVGRKLPAAGSPAGRGRNTEALGRFVSQGDVGRFSAVDEIFPAYRSRLARAFLVAREIDRDQRVVQQSVSVQGFERGHDHHVTALHVVGPLSGGGGVVEFGKGRKGHRFFKNRVEVTDQEKFFALISFPRGYKMSGAVQRIRQRDPLGGKAHRVELALENIAHGPDTRSVEGTAVDIDDFFQQIQGLRHIGLHFGDDFDLGGFEVLGEGGKRSQQETGQEKFFHQDLGERRFKFSKNKK